MKEIKTDTAKSHNEYAGQFHHKRKLKKRNKISSETTEETEDTSETNRRCRDTDIYSSRLLFFSHLHNYLKNIVLPSSSNKESSQINELICSCDCEILQVKTPEVFFKNLKCKCPVLWENCNREHGKVHCYCWNLKQKKNKEFFELFQNEQEYPNAESIARKIIMLVKPDQDYPKPLKTSQYTAKLIKEFKADIIAYTIMCINLISLAYAHDKIRKFYGYKCCKPKTLSGNCGDKLQSFLSEFKLYIKYNSNTEEYEKAQKIIESIEQQLTKDEENKTQEYPVKHPTVKRHDDGNNVGNQEIDSSDMVLQVDGISGEDQQPFDCNEEVEGFIDFFIV